MNEENQHESLNAEMQEYAFEHIDKVYQKQALHDRQTLVISAFGGPGSGKTVACMDICQQLKKRGYNAEYVSEVAKDYVYDENFEMLDGTAEHQYEILQEQLKRVDRYIGKVDFVVTDSPILLNGIYNQQLTPEYARTLLEIHGQYNNFVFFVNRDKTQFQQEGRIHDLQESMEKDLQIQNLLDDNKIYYGTYNHETVGKIVDNSIHTLHRIRDAHSNQLVKDFVLQNYQEGYVDIEKVDDLKYKLTDKTGDSMEVIIEKDKIVVPVKQEPAGVNFPEGIDEARLDEIGEKMSFVDEKELHPVYQAKGWERYDDGSGGLIDIHGKTLVSYDLWTKELMGSNLPFTSHKLYINYSYDSCGFKKIREDAVRWLNNNYENALERANELVEPYRQDADNYYKVVSTENPEYPFNVQKITSGYYSGNGKFCKDIDEVKEYVEGEHLNEITDKIIEDAMEIDEARLDELAEEMLLEAQAASQGPVLGM